MNALTSFFRRAVLTWPQILPNRFGLFWAGVALGLGLLALAAEKETVPPALLGGVPIGVIVPFAGSTNQIPESDGWLLCDGREVSAQDYAALFGRVEYTWGKGAQADTFRLPDLRGRFLRGVDHTPSAESRDPDRNDRRAAYPGGNTGNTVGSVQEDEVKLHRHPIMGSAWAIGNGVPGTDQLVRFHARKAPDENAPSYANNDPVLPAGGAESRPKNAAVNWIIKAK